MVCCGGETPTMRCTRGLHRGMFRFGDEKNKRENCATVILSTKTRRFCLELKVAAVRLGLIRPTYETSN
ncbi:unnamed protein product [Tenebrio molitor]|nr:unnamed protein product [Tenebrio molitor]